MSENIYDHNRISPTAKLVAYLRQLTDIPYAADVAKAVHAEEACLEMFRGSGVELAQLRWAAPYAEARYKSILAAIKREKMTQVLEIASGLSLRGVAMTETMTGNDPHMIYVETDLPGMHEEKLRVLGEIFGADQEITKRPNLFFHAANILEESDLDATVAHFQRGTPVAVVNEGLFQYLSMPEKERAARNILGILRRFGGVWITPDLETKRKIDERQAQRPIAANFMASFSRATGRDFKECAFEDDAHIESFFTDLGLTIEVAPQVDGSFELSSMKGIVLPPGAMDRINDHLKLWFLRPASSQGGTA